LKKPDLQPKCIQYIYKVNYQNDVQFYTYRIRFDLHCKDIPNGKSKRIYYNRIPIISCMQYYVKTIYYYVQLFSLLCINMLKLCAFMANKFHISKPRSFGQQNGERQATATHSLSGWGSHISLRLAHKWPSLSCRINNAAPPFPGNLHHDVAAINLLWKFLPKVFRKVNWFIFWHFAQKRKRKTANVER